MGVDLEVYRARVGQFIPRTVKDVVSNIKYLCKAIASVRSDLTHDKLDIKGAVTFIDLLLRIQGIEPNPGPRKTDQQSHAAEPTEDSTDINVRFDSNVNPVSADQISQVVEVLMDSKPSPPESSPTSESTSAVAIPGPSSGTVSIPTTVKNVLKHFTAKPVQINFNIGKVQHGDKINVGTMKVKQADNVCMGNQTVINEGNKEDDDIPKPKKRKKMMKAAEKKNKRSISQVLANNDSEIPKPKKKKQDKARTKTPKRLLLEGNTEVMLKRHIEETFNLLVTGTEAEKAVVKCLKNYNMVVISGVTGEGKTTLGREICRKLRDGILDKGIERKTPVLITVPQDWSDVVNDKDDIVVFVDDIFGKTNYLPSLLNEWKPFFDRILQSLHEGKVCLVVTSCTHILKDARRESGVLKDMVSDHILSEKKTVDLTDDQRLTKEERLSIYDNYSRQRQTRDDGVSSKSLQHSAAYSSTLNTAVGFPQICKLFFNNEMFFKTGEQFFKNPDRILTEEIEKMRLTEPHKYFALVYCFLSDNCVDTKKLNRLEMSGDDYDTLKVYAEVCGVPHTNNVTTMLENSLESLDRTYLKKQNTVFTFGHQSIADSVSLLFGKKHPEITLEKCSDRVILELLDVSEEGQTDMYTLHVPSKYFQQLVKRMYKIIMKEGNRITLESFLQFRNQKLADCLFKYITTQGDTKGFVKAHCFNTSTRTSMQLLGSLPGSVLLKSFPMLKTVLEDNTDNLLKFCSTNAFFLKAFYKFKFYDFMVKDLGILTFAKTLQGTLKSCWRHKRMTSMSVLLENGAFFKSRYLQLAIHLEDKDLVEFMLSHNAWTKSEIKLYTRDDTPDHIRNILERGTNMFVWNRHHNQYICQSTADTVPSSMCTKDITTAAEEKDFDKLHAIFQAPELKKHCHHLIKIILESKHKTLSDAIAIKMILGQIDGKIVQHALHNCDLDMFRFFLFSSNTDTAQLNSMLSEAIHLNKTDHIEVLTKAGGLPSLDDFVRKAGTNLPGVERVVEAIIQGGNWTSAQLADALDEAVCSGTHDTMKVLFESGARFTQNALVNVSRRKDYQLEERTVETESSETLQWLSALRGVTAGDILSIKISVPVTVEYVFLKHESSPNEISDAINAALESGSSVTWFYLKLKGGTFRNDALLAAVRRMHITQKDLRFLRSSENWSVDQLSEALHQALILCRPDVIEYLNTEGAVFNDSSLKNVLRWHVEHHIQVKFIKYILRARSWSQELLNEAIQFACKSNGLAILSVLEMIERKSELLTRDVLLKLEEIGQLKEKIIQILKSEDRQDDLALVLNKEIQQGCEDVVEHLICKLNIPCGDDSLSNAMDNSQNYQRYDRLKMVRLVHESRHWSDESLMKALDKALKLGYTEVVFYLHDHGAMFSDQSLECAIMDKTGGYDIYALVTYLMKSHQYNKEQMNNALQKSLEIGHFQLLTMLCENGAEFADKSLQRVIHKKWKLSDRLPAVQLVLNAREWNADEKNEALLSAVKLGDARVIRCILRCGGVVSRRCLLELLEKKCKPSHRLSILRLLIPSSGSLSQDLLRDVRENAKLLLESKLEAYIQQFIV